MQPTIFVHIAAYRDAQLVPTIEDALAKASHPERLTFGVCWQGNKKDKALIKPLLKHPQVRWAFFDLTESKGACWARHQASKLIANEDYVLQIDSHTRFVEGWDEKIIQYWLLTLDGSAVLTTYLPSFVPGAEGKPDQLNYSPPQRIEVNHFNDANAWEGLVTLKAGKIIKDEKPIFNPLGIAAGCIFGKPDFWRECPYDPDLYFFGEEITLAARAYTSGFNVYNLHEHIAYHWYGREGVKRHWDDNSVGFQLDQVAREKVKKMLVDRIPVTSGLGTARSIEEWESIVRVDFRNKLFSALP